MVGTVVGLGVCTLSARSLIGGTMTVTLPKLAVF